MAVSNLDFHWAAGLLEGEGAFYVEQLRHASPRGRIQCHMTDLDVLERLRDSLGVGRLNGPYAQPASERSQRRLSWIFQINRQVDVARVARRLRPCMGGRRQKQIVAMLEAMGEEP